MPLRQECATGSGWRRCVRMGRNNEDTRPPPPEPRHDTVPRSDAPPAMSDTPPGSERVPGTSGPDRAPSTPPVLPTLGAPPDPAPGWSSGTPGTDWSAAAVRSHWTPPAVVDDTPHEAHSGPGAAAPAVAPEPAERTPAVAPEPAEQTPATAPGLTEPDPRLRPENTPAGGAETVDPAAPGPASDPVAEPSAAPGGTPAPRTVAAVVAVCGLVLAGIITVTVVLAAAEPPDRPATADPPRHTGSARPTGTPFRPATDVRLADHGDYVKLSWTDRSGGRARYVVLGARSGASKRKKLTEPGRATTRRIDGLSAEADYCFTVVAMLSDTDLRVSRPVCTNRRHG